jgi:hypothetical protein
MTLRGRCLCGDIRYQLDGVPAVMGVCHCKRCQRQGGSAFSTMAGVPREAFTLLRGDPVIYPDGATNSGATAEISFCGRCGSPIYTVLDNQPDMLLLKTGTLDDTTWFRPQFHVWCADKQQWVDIAEDARRDRADEP